MTATCPWEVVWFIVIASSSVEKLSGTLLLTSAGGWSDILHLGLQPVAVVALGLPIPIGLVCNFLLPTIQTSCEFVLEWGHAVLVPVPISSEPHEYEMSFSQCTTYSVP